MKPKKKKRITLKRAFKDAEKEKQKERGTELAVLKFCEELK